MPVRIISKEYTVNGVPLTYFQANPGDDCTATITIESIIKMSSLTNPMFYDYSVNEATSPSLSWLDEGFRIGAWLTMNRYTQFGVLLGTYTTIVTYVDDQIIQFSTPCYSGWAIISQQEYMTIEVFSYNRESVEFSLNLCKNALIGTQFSLIDGEATRFSFPEISSLAVGANTNALIIGNQSGQALYNASVLRLPNVGNAYMYELQIRFFQTGWYDEEWFESNNCLKPFIRGAWSTFDGEPFNQTISVIDDEADSGFFNEPFNSQEVDSTLIAGFGGTIAYDQPTNIPSVVVEGSLGTLAIGAVYKSEDSAYFKNRLIPQQEISFLAPTVTALLPLHPSFTQVIPIYGTAGYTITVNSVTTVGVQHTIDMTFTPNTAFADWFDEREEGDRLFYVWVKCGNINHLIYADQLTKAPPVGGPLEFVDKWEFLDHFSNIDTNAEITPTVVNNFKFDTEDDLAFAGKFLIEKEQIVQKLVLSVEAFNTVTEEKFTLKKDTFSFDGVQISADGRYLLNETLAVNTGLPSTSKKINASLSLSPDIDIMDEYGVFVYYPIVLRWEYWLEQLNANVAFYPNQDKNWERYDDLTDWQVRLFVDLQKDNLSYIYGSQIGVSPYDNDANVTTDIKLFRTIEGLEEVNFIPIGEVLRVETTFTSATLSWSPIGRLWHQVRVYPTENAPPFINSTVVPFDGDASNYINPISGNLIVLDAPSSLVRVSNVLLDSNKIDLSNGVTITSKIKDGVQPLQERFKKEYKAVQLPSIYQEENRGYSKCCTTQLVLANDSGDIAENDITPAWVQLSDGSDTVSFIVRKCTGEEIEVTPKEFVNQQNAYYCEVYWSEVLADLGVGQYQLLIVSNIGGIDFNFTWGIYNLMEYSIETAKNTVRLRALFNSFHEIENIDFTGSNVNGTIRFKGAFGFRDPNTQIDNLVMQGRTVESVVRENLNRYTLKTDPLYEPMVDLITDLYLLSENNLWISDHNPHNHSYKYRDLFVSLEEKITPEYKELSRYASLTAIFGDKVKNKRTYFK